MSGNKYSNQGSHYRPKKGNPPGSGKAVKVPRPRPKPSDSGKKIKNS